MERYREFKQKNWTLRGQWGIFSKEIPNRIGQQCSKYYRALLERGILYDSNYSWKNGSLIYSSKSNNNNNSHAIRIDVEPFNRNNNNDLTIIDKENLVEGVVKSLHSNYDPLSVKQQLKVRNYLTKRRGASTASATTSNRNKHTSTRNYIHLQAKNIQPLQHFKPKPKSSRKSYQPQRRQENLLSKYYITYSISEENMIKTCSTSSVPSDYPLLYTFKSKSHLFATEENDIITSNNINWISNWKYELDNIEFNVFYVERNSTRFYDVKSQFESFFGSLLGNIDNIADNTLQDIIYQLLYIGTKGIKIMFLLA